MPEALTPVSDARRSARLTERWTLVAAADDLLQLIRGLLELSAAPGGVRGPAQGPERQPPL